MPRSTKSISDAEALAKEARKWRALPKRSRHDLLMEEIAKAVQQSHKEAAARATKKKAWTC